MNTSSLNIKRKIALHSFGLAFILSMLFLISLSLSKTPSARYLIAGLLTAEILKIIINKRRYLTSIQQDDFKITVKYLNRMLLKKIVSISKGDLNIYNVTESNWWFGNLDLINFSNGEQDLTFECIDRKLKQSILDTFGKE